MRNKIPLLIILSLVLIAVFLLNLCIGSVKIPLNEIVGSVVGDDFSKKSWEIILWNYRLPKALMAVLAGGGLAVSGLLMQTLFRNPLAGPDVIGLSSGASLGVAIVVMGNSLIPEIFATFFLSGYGLILASVCGSFLVLLAVLAVSQKLRDTMSVLIVGIMFASFASAFIGILTYFSTAFELQKFAFWSFGSLGNQSFQEILILFSVIFIGLILAVFALKSLNALLLGENYAESLGINLKKMRLLIIISTSILAGSITAFTGPIAFIGLAVPHFARLIFKTSNHKLLFCATLLLGAIILLVCDTICQFPGKNFTLPINAVTSVFGAPVVIWLMIRNRKMMI
ncbi:iron ABC transporter permease [Flavobacterium ichthyis]|uniref:iron ABC transporter permease n=1 Tax=Flavobacterium ichthyis TaxID=2698827 RepID=UPI001F423D15|nr:iron ABC transporter permease [Flavobacterium ichthyis]